uniref:Cytochrome P450 n=1 Tax=Panagrolaimus sp. JU765 TaxID=591449 RepID=A0AC34RBX2_9BILA
MTNLLLIGLFHETLDDVVVGGHKIPKGTVIVPQISNVLFNEQIFPEPFKFDPERFLDSSGNLKKIDELMPFGLGKRQCLGESLARMELFLILSNLFRHFEVLPEKDAPPSMEKLWGIAMQPEPFKIRVEKRKL